MAQDHHNVGMQRFQEKTDFKFEEEDNAISSFSNIQIDPNSTRSISLEKKLAPKPDEEHTTTTKPISKGSFIFSSPLLLIMM
jgi:hypothetical protein